MANRGYGWRDRGDDVEDRFGRGRYYGGGMTGEENWGRTGGYGGRAYGGYEEPYYGWRREGISGGRYAGERGGYEEEPYRREAWGPEGWGRERGTGRYFSREPYAGGYGWEAGSYGSRFAEPYGRYGTGGEPYYRGSAAYGGYTDRYASEGRRSTYAGRGPKGWRRSDERIRDEVSEALARHPDIDASDLEVRVENGVVTLSGVVEDRREKRFAEDIAEDTFGVDDVHNELKIRHGFLAGLTGEKADEREVGRKAQREMTSAGTAAETRATATRATGRTTGT